MAGGGGIFPLRICQLSQCLSRGRGYKDERRPVGTDSGIEQVAKKGKTEKAKERFVRHSHSAER